MDTKLKNYKKPVCFFSGLIFIAVSTLLMKEACRIIWLYDFENYLRWAPEEFDFYQSSNAEMVALEEVLSDSWMSALIYLGIILVTLVLCIWMTGKKLNWFDKIFTEIQVFAAFFPAIGLAGMCVIHIDCFMRSDWHTELLMQLGFDEKEIQELASLYSAVTDFEPQWLENFFAYAGTAVLIGLCLLFVLSWVKKWKAHCFWRTTLIGSIFCGIGDGIKNTKGVQGKVIAILLIGALLSATWVGLIAVVAAIFFFIPKQVRKYVAIRDGVEEVKNGNLEYKIPVPSDGKLGELDRLAESINAISEATSIAVANEVKNQRLKTDLISNVSHDLKTPLTSMVSYVDLLKNEGLDSEHAPQYLDIIDEKTRRLRKLTEDLFEAAKASSGSIPVHIDRIEMSSIVNQALAEVGERLDASDLEIIFTNKAEDTFVLADGQLLWRVMENLLVNVSKYALPGSRVYLDILDNSEDKILMEIKNMSKDRLNIDADELMERFKRGDESRNTEGSGLGLAIAKDLVKLMDGEFDLTIDGDLFKASVALKKAK